MVRLLDVEHHVLQAQDFGCVGMRLKCAALVESGGVHVTSGIASVLLSSAQPETFLWNLPGTSECPDTRPNWY